MKWITLWRCTPRNHPVFIAWWSEDKTCAEDVVAQVQAGIDREEKPVACGVCGAHEIIVDSYPSGCQTDEEFEALLREIDNKQTLLLNLAKEMHKRNN